MRHKQFPGSTVFIARERHFIDHSIKVLLIFITDKKFILMRVNTVFHILYAREEHFERIGRPVGRDIPLFRCSRACTGDKDMLFGLAAIHISAEAGILLFINQFTCLGIQCLSVYPG
ncbi:hypothetical protein SDC9_198402 [bioreactor metagenome]|uniref:Uncharacterized protein n=1 Tax=bioreactor metagenome TaxID=1076179 RepID=A0A645IJX0_9ZZZZ